MRLLTAIVDWRRALLLLPLIVALGAVLFVLASRDDAAGTPRAVLVDTPGTGADAGTTKGKLARDFIAYSPEGEAVRLSDLRGTPAIINFWATWCASCAAELPDLHDLQTDLGPERVRIVIVNVGEGSERARGFLGDVRATSLTVAMDPSLVIADTYGVRGMPQSVFIDSAGIIRAVYTGQLKTDVMRDYLDSTSRGADQPDDQLGPIRLVTTVARDHVLEVRSLNDGRAEFRSKSLRCDDAYCAEAVVDAVAAAEGVLSVERQLGQDPPTIAVTFDPQRTDVRRLAAFVAGQIEEFPDPLYTRPLEVVFP